MPSMSGKMRSPDTVGLTPLTFWRNSGRNVRAPNMAKPITKPMALAALKTRTVNSFNGITGSAANRSAKKKPTASTTPRTAVEMLGAETQAHETPPKLAKTISDVADPASNTRPERSRSCGAPCAGGPAARRR